MDRLSLARLLLVFLLFLGLNTTYGMRCAAVNRPEQIYKWADRIDTVGSCYLMRTEQKINFYKARELCESYGANSVVLDNEAETDVVAELVAEVDPSFIFYTDIDQVSRGYKYYPPKKWWQAGKKWIWMKYPTDWLQATSHNETLHEIAYAPWTHKDRHFLDDHTRHKGIPTAIVIKASDGRYDVRNIDTTYAYALCEKHVGVQPPF